MTAPLRVALLGCGTVGAEVVRLLRTSGDDLTARVGAPLELAGIAVRRLGRVRDLPVDPELFTTDASALVARDDGVRQRRPAAQQRQDGQADHEEHPEQGHEEQHLQTGLPVAQHF